jgi:chemotaxis response regulator CheB
MVHQRILLVTPRGATRDSLTAVLRALVSKLELVEAVSTAQAARLAGRIRPDLVIINTEIGYTESLRLYEKLAAEEGVRVLILSEAVQWQRWKKRRLACPILLKGFSTQEFQAALEL